MNVTSSTGRTALRPKPAAPRLPARQSTRLLDPMRECIRLLRCSRRTEAAYVHGIRTFESDNDIRTVQDLLGHADMAAT